MPDRALSTPLDDSFERYLQEKGKGRGGGGDGDQAAAVERLRSKLEERGWFDDEQKQQPPAFPERVGVVTSLRGDARYDI